MQHLIFLCLAFLSNPHITRNKIKFEQGLSWAQVKEKAQAENKYIFLDCFTTWCGPCKKMDMETYNNIEVTEYLNANFISVKVQLDTTATDQVEVQKWYQEARTIMNEYHVNSYPTFIFLSPMGKLVHKGIGFMPADVFITVLKKATDPNEQYYTLLDAFRKRQLSYSRMFGLTKGLESMGEKGPAMDVANSYINDYVLKLHGKDLYNEENIRFISYHIQNTKSQTFAWYYKNADSINNIMGPGFAKATIDYYIFKEEVAPLFLKWDSAGIVKVENEKWEQLQGDLSKKYNKEYADRILLNAQIRWYSLKKQWQEMVFLNVKKIDIYGLDTTKSRLGPTNNMIYEVIFQHSNDKKVLDKAAKWMQLICEADPNEQDYLDTYANLLYKSGDKKNAIAFEEKALALHSRESKEIAESLAKMRKGEPTWPVN